MADVGLYTFTFKEVAETLIKKQNIHEGHWQIHIEVPSGANLAMMNRGSDIVPAIVIPIARLGIRRLNTPNPMSIDASEINPKKE
jgi:hypothetical protein